MNRSSLTRSLRSLLADPVGGRLLASANETVLAQLAGYLARDDPYGEAMLIEAALKRVGQPGAWLTVAHHEIWCVHREAAWQCGRSDLSSEHETVLVEGESWLRETEGHPTVLVSPMTLALSDAYRVLVRAIRQIANGRAVIIYGDGIEPGDAKDAAIDRVIAGDGRGAMQRIVDVLAANGVFCTYADFVYQGHAAAKVELFGGPHWISSSLVTLASRPNTMLLPCLLLGAPTEPLRCRFYEPTLIADEGAPRDVDWRSRHHQAVAQLLASTLEMLIAEAPERWRLLATLTHHCPQMERS